MTSTGAHPTAMATLYRNSVLYDPPGTSFRAQFWNANPWRVVVLGQCRGDSSGSKELGHSLPVKSRRYGSRESPGTLTPGAPLKTVLYGAQPPGRTTGRGLRPAPMLADRPGSDRRGSAGRPSTPTWKNSGASRSGSAIHQPTPVNPTAVSTWPGHGRNSPPRACRLAELGPSSPIEVGQAHGA